MSLTAELRRATVPMTVAQVVPLDDLGRVAFTVDALGTYYIALCDGGEAYAVSAQEILTPGDTMVWEY